jgi:CRP-like cAMP-binding protein
MASNPRIARAVVRFLCRRLRQADLQIEMIALHSVEVRLARFLLAALRISRATPSTAGVPLKLSISQSEIGLLIGASRPKVNAGFSSLIGSGAIKKKGTTLVCNVEQLEAICEESN